MKFDKIDRKILLELDRNARIPETKLAKIVGRSKESVRYRIKQLKSKGIIHGFTIWIDPTKLGYSTAKIYLTLANNPTEKQKFVDYVTKDKRLFWLGIAEGSWNAGLTYFVKSTQEFFDLKNELFSKFKELILNSHTGMLVGVNVKEKAFFYPSKTEWKTCFASQEHFALETLEANILKELFKNSRTNIVSIARKLNTTVDKVRTRIKRLEGRKVIFRYVAIIDLPHIGYDFYKAFLYFKNLTKQDEKRLMEYTRKEPKIVHLIKQISPWDIELEIMCESYADYNKIISNLTQEFSTVISKVETAIMGEDYVFPAQKMVFE